MTSNMEVDSAQITGVFASSGTGSVSVSLHPLVIMNISEHWTRVCAQENKSTQVVGALIGKQTGRKVDVMNSFEFVIDKVENDIVIDMTYYHQKEEQFKQVFSDLDFLGWYTTGDGPNPSDIIVHKQICEIHESPIFLKLNPLSRNVELPISVYESVIDLINGEATMQFIELSYTLETEEAERIGIDHGGRMSTTENAEHSTVAELLTSQHNSVKMLHSRITLILEYIKAVEAGSLPKNHDILREAYSMCYRLPVLNNCRFTEDFFNQCNDVSLMSYLGTMTKGCNSINQFVNKFNVLYGREGMGRRMRGLFF